MGYDDNYTPFAGKVERRPPARKVLWTMHNDKDQQVSCTLLAFHGGGLELQLHQGDMFYKGRRCPSMADALSYAGKVYGDLLGRGWTEGTPTAGGGA